MSPRSLLALVPVGVLATLMTATPAGAQVPPPGGTTTTVAPTTTVPLATTPPTTIPTTTVVGDPSGRQWLVPVPIGCDAPLLPDVVFVGTLRETGTPSGQVERTENETARFQVDQVRAGAVDRYAYGGLIDVRYGVDTKYLDEGEQYLVAASVDPAAGVLASKVRQPEPEFGGDEVIGASESDVNCPELADPVRTTHTDGTSIEAGVLTPLAGAKRSVLRALLLPTLVAFGVIFVLVAIRWLLTGIGKGVGSVVHTAGQTREVRSATRGRPRYGE
ncbi:MAG TPA: hypothetical protein VFT09_01185 [Ilumatobacteraceae bacterium]|nr:hypothetical protein [Ilumatobacteraceae bacterium]